MTELPIDFDERKRAFPESARDLDGSGELGDEDFPYMRSRGERGGPEAPGGPEGPEGPGDVDDLDGPEGVRRPGRPLAPPSREKFRGRPEQVYQLKRSVFELLGDVNRAEVAKRLYCSPTTLSHYVTSAKWWPRDAYERLVAVVVGLRGTVDDELLGQLEEHFSAAEQQITPAVYEIGQLQAQIRRYVEQLAGLRQEHDTLLQQSTAASGDDQAALQRRISELEEELRAERRRLGRLKEQLIALRCQLAASGDPAAALEAARYAADEVARIAEPVERRERALEAVSELEHPDGVGEFIGHLRTQAGTEDARVVLEDIVLCWTPARIAEYVATLNATTGLAPAADGASDTDRTRARLSALYRQITKADLHTTALRLLGAEAFAGFIHVLRARQATELAGALLTERAAQRDVEGIQQDAHALGEHAQHYLIQAVWRSLQEIADLVAVLRAEGQDQHADWVLDRAGGSLSAESCSQLEAQLTAAGRINDLRILLSGRKREGN